MGQYFQPVNVSRKEFFNPPSPMKPIERVTDHATMAMFGYLFFEGPLDGCPVLPNLVDEDRDDVEERVAQLIEEEEQLEAERDGDRQSIYRDDDGEWRYDRLRRTAVAGFEIAEALEYAGRWAGDDVRFVGDYADNDLYGATSPTVEVQPLGWDSATVTVDYARHPVEEGSWNIAGITHRMPDKQLEVGDYMQVKQSDDGRLGDDTYGEVLEISNDWTDITEGLAEEFQQFVGDDWLEANVSERDRRRTFGD